MNFSRRVNHKIPAKKERVRKRKEEKKKQKKNWFPQKRRRNGKNMGEIW